VSTGVPVRAKCVPDTNFEENLMNQAVMIGIAAAVAIVVGYLLVMRVFFKDSKELDKKIDYSKMKEWKDED
jgi:low affinity Fe/Cu permease